MMTGTHTTRTTEPAASKGWSPEATPTTKYVREQVFGGHLACESTTTAAIEHVGHSRIEAATSTSSLSRIETGI